MSALALPPALQAVAEAGGAALALKLVDRYLGLVPERVAAIKAAVADDERARAYHKLKGSSAQLGFTEVAEICARGEAAARQGDSRAAKGTVEELEGALGRAAELGRQYGARFRSEIAGLA